MLRALGKPSSRFAKGPRPKHPTDAWFDDGFQVFYRGTKPTVELIEPSGGAGFRATLYGRSVFSTPAGLLVRRLTRFAAVDETDPELGFTYIFPAIQIGLWRPATTRPDGRLFATVGAGIRNYHRAG